MLEHRKLELAYNRISHDGVKMLVDWFLVEGSRNRLTHLNLDGNVSAEPRNPLRFQAAALRPRLMMPLPPRRLIVMHRSGQVCGDEVTQDFARLLQRGPFLQHLLIRGNFLCECPQMHTPSACSLRMTQTPILDYSRTCYFLSVCLCIVQFSTDRNGSDLPYARPCILACLRSSHLRLGPWPSPLSPFSFPPDYAQR
jgi:hypothetical protein